VAVNTSSSTAAARSKQYACECECGWSVDPNTGRCEAPGGTCPLFPSDGAGGPLLLAGSNATSRSSAAGGGSAGCSSDAVAATGGSCPAKYGFDFVSKTCKSCDDGWGGAGCKQCATDEACKVSQRGREGEGRGGGHVQLLMQTHLQVSAVGEGAAAE
jgi:hypothetical protein